MWSEAVTGGAVPKVSWWNGDGVPELVLGAFSGTKDVLDRKDLP